MVAEMINGKVVLIGGTGFILSHATERNAQNGNEVVIFDNNLEHDFYEETRKLIDQYTNVHTKADLTAAKKYLGWEPKTSLIDGLKKTIPYYARLMGM